MLQRRNGLPVGSIPFVVILIALPFLLVALAGWPGAVSPLDAMTRLGLLGEIAGPSPHLGMSPAMIRWGLLVAGMGLGIVLGVGVAVALLEATDGAGQGIPARIRLGLLALLGAVSLAVYGSNFLLPFPLLRYYGVRLGSMGVIAVRDAGIALSLTVGTVALFLLYGLAYWLCRGQGDRRLWAIVWLGALLFAVCAFLVAPITSLDVYDYIALARITGVHGGNPYIQSPGDYPADPFMGYASWQEATSPYGPLWETLVGLLSRLAGHRLLPNLLTFKGLALAGHLASVILIAAILRRVAPARALSGTLLFAWNPLVLLEALPNAHNDSPVVALLLGAFWVFSLTLDRAQAIAEEISPDERFWKRVYGGLALLVLGAAVLVKLIPLLFFPPFLLVLLAGEKGWRRIGVGLLLVAPVILFAVEYYRPFWHWPEIVSVFGQRMGMFRMSVASVTRQALQPYVGQSAEILVRSFLVVFALAYLVVLVRVAYAVGLWSRAGLPGAVERFLFGRRPAEGQRPWDVLIGACLSIFLLYLLLGNFWFWPWYLILPIALLALAGDERVFLPLLLAGCAGEISHVGWNFVWYWWGVSWDTLYRLDALVVFFMIVPALVVYAISLRSGPPPFPTPGHSPSLRLQGEGKGADRGAVGWRG